MTDPVPEPDPWRLFKLVTEARLTELVEREAADRGPFRLVIVTSSGA